MFDPNKFMGFHWVFRMPGGKLPLQKAHLEGRCLHLLLHGSTCHGPTLALAVPTWWEGWWRCDNPIPFWRKLKRRDVTVLASSVGLLVPNKHDCKPSMMDRGWNVNYATLTTSEKVFKFLLSIDRWAGPSGKTRHSTIIPSQKLT